MSRDARSRAWVKSQSWTFHGGGGGRPRASSILGGGVETRRTLCFRSPQGAQGDDKALAGALWRVMLMCEGNDPSALETLVCYVRRQVRRRRLNGDQRTRGVKNAFARIRPKPRSVVRCVHHRTEAVVCEPALKPPVGCCVMSIGHFQKSRRVTLCALHYGLHSATERSGTVSIASWTKWRVSALRKDKACTRSHCTRSSS